MKNLKNITQKKVFYGYIYPVFAKEFLIECQTYEQFARVVSNVFILTPEQWNSVLLEWEIKEDILS